MEEKQEIQEMMALEDKAASQEILAQQESEELVEQVVLPVLVAVEPEAVAVAEEEENGIQIDQESIKELPTMADQVEQEVDH
jgi:LDH2 family malate/lactate/ureidoglycolate dehydrogenase